MDQEVGERSGLGSGWRSDPAEWDLGGRSLLLAGAGQGSTAPI